MKAFVVFAALVAAAQAGIASQGVSPSLMQAALKAKWSAFKAQHGKEYSEDDESRMSRFLSTTQKIEEHNARFHQGLESFEMGHNVFSDMTQEEIDARMGLRMPPNAEELMANVSCHVSSSGYQAPASLDWRTWGAVQVVKDQGQCGSCYSFSAIGALETAYWVKHRSLPNLSEQQIVDCAKQYGYQAGGCQGGWMHESFRYFQEREGSASQQSYPYTARVGQCVAASKPKVANVASYQRIRAGDEKALFDAVATIGTVSIAYNAGPSMNYQRGVLDVNGCGNQPTHAVLVTGYGNENGKDFWAIKNSWGTGWGDKGYFKMVRGKNMCGIADWASYPVAK